MPSLNEPWVSRMNWVSLIPSMSLKVLMCGRVASPTPTVAISSDSIRVMS
jgi:hypothetical protein